MMEGEKDGRRLLPVDFVPSPQDVVCGRDQESVVHDGNLRLRYLIREILPTYQHQLSTKKAKSKMVLDIVDQIRTGSPNGGFVRKDLATGRWFEIGEMKAREKVGHLIRIELRKQQKVTGIPDTSSSKAPRLAEKSLPKISESVVTRLGEGVKGNPLNEVPYISSKNDASSPTTLSLACRALEPLDTSYKNANDYMLPPRIHQTEERLLEPQTIAKNQSVYQTNADSFQFSGAASASKRSAVKKSRPFFIAPTNTTPNPLGESSTPHYFYVPPRQLSSLSPSQDDECQIRFDSENMDEARVTLRPLPFPNQMTIREGSMRLDGSATASTLDSPANYYQHEYDDLDHVCCTS